MASATLIGDIVSSRHSGARALLHDRLSEALARVNADFAPLARLRITVGDEFQGRFRSLNDAVQASLRLTLALRPTYDVRHGLGWGDTESLSADPPVEDGPGWWAARAAIEAVAAEEASARTRQRRTAYRLAEDAEGPDAALVNAGLILRDASLARLDERSLSVLAGLLASRSQREIAAELGISPSAVSQRVRTDGLELLASADAAVAESRHLH